MAELSLSSESISTLSSDISDVPNFIGGSRTDSFGTSYSDEEERDHFQHDASTSIYDSLRDRVSADVVHLELVSLRMSANASDHQVRRAIVSAFMKSIQQLMESGKSAGAAVKELFRDYREVVKRSIFDKTEDDYKQHQVDLLLLIQQDLIHRNKGDTILLFVAKELYELEIVEEEAYEQWWTDERSSNSEELRQVRSQTEQFVDWLANAEEEESDGESNDE
jgi:translation initiation factor eIF-2B subunit epsilon